MLLLVYFFVSTIGSFLKNNSLIYYCNYVLGTYNDGITKTLLSVIGGLPMGIGIFIVFPLSKKFGKARLTVYGSVLVVLGDIVSWLFPSNLYVVLVGQFIKKLGGLPGAYFFMALFADSFDHLEWKTGFRSDGFAMSVYLAIIVILSGVGTAILNGCLTASGYIPPISTDSLAEAEVLLAQNGWLPQLSLDAYKPTLDGTYIIGIRQASGTVNVISFLYLGLEAITSLLGGILIAFITMERALSRKQAVIRERQKKACEAEGKEWVAPETLLEEEQRCADEEADYRKELQAKCEKKGMNYETELEKHVKELEDRRRKAAEKQRLAEEKQAKKAQLAEQKRAAPLAKLTPRQRDVLKAKEQKREAKEEAAWEKESAKGEISYRKMQKMLAKYNEAALRRREGI